MTLLRRSPSPQHPVAQDCLRLLGGMLRSCSSYQLTSEQLRFLLQWAFADLELAGDQQQHMFVLLRAVLNRKAVMVEVYDVMEKVQVGGGGNSGLVVVLMWSGVK
jgi:U3 small nucleolar RNA-associated protein 20